MADIHSFRRLWHGPPRRLSRPHFLRDRRWPRLAWLGRYGGLIALAAVMGAGLCVYGPWRETGTPPVVTTPATVIDGDTLRIGGERIRLVGMDAPELRQTCRDESAREWPCGQAAKARLAALVSRHGVTCSPRGLDRYGRTLAVCTAGDAGDVGEMLVREGFAVSYGDYWLAEATARLAGRGLWDGTFERPQDWRRRH